MKKKGLVLLSRKRGPATASEYRVKVKTDAIMRHERNSFLEQLEPDDSLTTQGKRRAAADMLTACLEDFSTENQLEACPASSNFRENKIDLPMNVVDFCKQYIAAVVDPADALQITSGLFPLPYSENEMNSLLKGCWYLLKRSHTKEGMFSFSCVNVNAKEHESKLGYIWTYTFDKKTNNAKNKAGGFISRNHNQYIFVGAERYIPDSGEVSYQGTQLISINMQLNSEKLPGIILNATHGYGDPCAAKVVLYYTPSASDEYSGLYKESDVIDIAKKIGIDPDVFSLPDDTPCNNWKLLVAN